MPVESNQVGTLLSNAASKQLSTYDLVKGVNQNITSSLLSGGTPAQAGTLTKTQGSTLSALEKFVQENLEGEEAAKILGSIAALRNLAEFGENNTNASIDPVLSLLAASPGLTGEFEAGSLIDELL